jgi:glycosyltransferase involved in cell wall biosynthesis
MNAPMPEYRVLVVTNLWPTEADPSYGAAIQAQMESLRPLGVKYDVLFINGRQSSANYVRSIFEVRRRVAAVPYDLIYAHFGLSGWVARFQRKAPLVVKFMGDDVLGQFDVRGRLTLVGRIFRISSFVLARHVDAAIVMSEGMKSRLRLETAFVVPTGVNLDLFRPIDPKEARRSLGLDAAKKYVLFPYGPDRVSKRLDLVQQAVRLAQAELPELEILQVFGVPQEQIPLYYNAADVLVLLSESEGSPNAVKEALAVNLPVISADVGDAVDLIGGSEGNYVVPRNPKIVAEKLVEACRRGGRTRSRERAEEFSMEAMARKVFEVCESVIRRSHGSSAP